MMPTRFQLPYVYIFLLGNCFIWYGTTKLYNEVFYLIYIIPVLLLFHKGRYVACILMGCIVAEFNAIEQQQWQFPEHLVRENHLIVGFIEGLPEFNATGVRVRFKVKSINHQELTTTKVSIRLGCFKSCPNFKADQHWQLLVRLKPVNGYINPTGYDYEKWLYGQQFKATGYILPSSSNKLLFNQPDIDSLREIIRDYYKENLSKPAVQGSAIALTLGDKSLLDKSNQQLLAESGLSHLMAISGLHIGLSAIPGFIFAGMIWRRIRFLQQFNRYNFQWLCCVIPAVCYSALSGFGLPAMRALVMLMVFVLVQLSRTAMSTHSRFSLALWFILLTQPLAILQVSFWLSFCATGILIFLSHFYVPKNPARALMKLQIRLFILLLPIQILIFGEVSLLSPLINFIAIPFVSLILLPLLLIQTTLILLTSIVTVNVVQHLTEFVLWIVEQLLTMFWLVISNLSPVTKLSKFSLIDSSYLQLLIYPLILIMLITNYKRLKLLIITMLFIFQFNTRNNDIFRLMVLDVGQGLALTINYNDKLLVYDTAYGAEDFKVAAMTLIPWLEKLAYPSISLLVVSHNDADHSGGAELVLNAQPVTELLTGTDVDLVKDITLDAEKVHYCDQERHWQWQDISIKLLSQHSKVINEEKFTAGNNSSCVLLVDYQGVKILLTGDIEGAAEQQLLQNYPGLTANVLLVPHHGSKTSSGWSFIEQLNSQIAIISSGYLNRFNQPAENILKRYQKHAVKVFNTADSGAVELTINQHGKIEIKQWRLENTGLWRRY